MAHVDSGKTTLAEGLLYHTGGIKQLGRVDHKDAYLDTFSLERERGITIFSKQARLEIGNKIVTLLDTPGHVDFSTEMERCLRVMDYGILVVSASTGVTGHTLTLWRLLKKYKVPTFIFVNKMDQEGTDKGKILAALEGELSDACIEMKSGEKQDSFYESIAMLSEGAMEEYLEDQKISNECIVKLIKDKELYPCYFGSALKLEGIEELIEGVSTYCIEPTYGSEFSAEVFKIERDLRGNKITYLKVKGGTLKLRDKIVFKNKNESLWEEKVNQIRLYSGAAYDLVEKVVGGEICGVVGLSRSKVGDVYGINENWAEPQIYPVMTYGMEFLGEVNLVQVFAKLKDLEEEEPSLGFYYNQQVGVIEVKLMGEIQIEILESIIKERFNLEVSFTKSRVIYKETIIDKVYGVGHFEPLRHYAEVHLSVKPGELGSGVTINRCNNKEKCLPQHENLIFTHLTEIPHLGVLMGGELTDIEITIEAGVGNEKHTQGGDFREATYRALQQALMQAQSVLLEPMYEFVIEVPMSYVGKVIYDIGIMEGEFEEPQGEGEFSIIKGFAPVEKINTYHLELLSITKGFGRSQFFYGGYKPVRNQEDRIQSLDPYNRINLFTPNSVFCKKGVGFHVPWDEVFEYAHLELPRSLNKQELDGENINFSTGDDLWIDQEEIDEIISRAYSNAGKKKIPYKQKNKGQIRVASGDYQYIPKERKKEYLLVDGYNIIFAWEELKTLAQVNIDGARERLMSLLSNVQGYKNNIIIVVFDAYKVKRNIGEIQQYHNISCVFTKEAETADAYIEKVAHRLSGKEEVVVATSDVIEQLIIMGQGARKMSANQLLEEVMFIEEEIRKDYIEQKESLKFHTIGHVVNNKDFKVDD